MDTVFSDNLKKFRQQKNLTQEQVSGILNVSVHIISRWECNTTLPDISMLPQIAKLYCVTIDDLFKETAVVYENYAQRLAAVYEATRQPEDLRCYGILHHQMMHYCIDSEDPEDWICLIAAYSYSGDEEKA